MKVRLTILGQPCSKANSRRLVTFGRGKDARPALIKSEDALAYEKSARKQLDAMPEALAMLQGRLRVTMTLYYATERPDLDESVVLDVLQARYRTVGVRRVLDHAGVYINDRQVREKHITHAIDRTSPRAEIEVEQLEAS